MGDSASMDPHARYGSPTSAARERDAALARAGRVRGLTIAGSAALSAALAGLVAASPPSKANTTATHMAATPVSTPARPIVLRAPALPPLASASALGLQAPSQAPQSSASNAGSSGAGSSGAGSSSGSSGSGGSSAAQSNPQEPTPAPPSQTVTPAAPAPAPAAPVVSGGS
jgi:uncharacterized membrane protein YgcG